ncbi:Tetratricopeptide-like helical [Penicillium taxi]|uniref:Tetratricopeptide-like helical n=1 Tax=Penicillium taxi TaxID=168475 RepID=UPI002545976C|nr:Tetratricopeptide-like helical [Penicillium taxi]KAJ5901756.1 Tetratricopeptide-like helical [Penicillium taxi]
MDHNTWSQVPDRQSSSIEYYDLGTFHRVVSTTIPDAQAWFNRGVVWAYAFNHHESIRCFEQAILFDPEFAMAYWGLAFSLGPNYNKPWQLFDGEDLSMTTARAHAAVVEAKKHADSATPEEKALINALQFRYPQEEPAEDCMEWNRRYAEAMLSVYQTFPDDLDIVALYADSLMNLNPWNLWNLVTGEPTPGAQTLEVKRALDRALERDEALEHPGLLHLYIHLMEMSATPEIALPIANNLRGLVPDAGHLEHMLSHLDVLCGNYRRAVTANTAAIRADEKFLSTQPLGHFYNIYRAHDYHFLMYAAMLGGQSKVAIYTANQLADSITEPLLSVKSPPLADWLEGFVAMRVHALVRFGCWEDIMSLEPPANQSLYCVTTAMTHYAKGIAFAATNRIKEAEKEQDLFKSSSKLVPLSRTIFNNTCVDVLGVAAPMLEGEIAYRRGDYDDAFAILQTAVDREDSLPYDEPWGWMQPVRHALGALLLEKNRVEEAIKVYSADLGIDTSLPRALRHPNNVWALRGYHECLTRLGRKAEARILLPQMRQAVAMADIPIRGSCFCRTTFETESLS